MMSQTDQLSDVFITNVGAYLPGAPIPNDEIEDYIGPLTPSQRRFGAKALELNGIKTRHFALDKNGNALINNAAMAAAAARQMFDRGELGERGIELIASAASQGDYLAPGIASMVHAELDIHAVEIASFNSFCASGMMALNYAHNAIRSRSGR